jgi:hypothetical protein
MGALLNVRSATRWLERSQPTMALTSPSLSGPPKALPQLDIGVPGRPRAMPSNRNSSVTVDKNAWLVRALAASAW